MRKIDSDIARIEHERVATGGLSIRKLRTLTRRRLFSKLLGESSGDGRHDAVAGPMHDGNSSYAWPGAVLFSSYFNG